MREYRQTKMLFETFYQNQVYPGGILALFEAGAWQITAVGNRQIKPFPLPTELDRYFDLASLTKVIGTLTLLLKLKESGRVDFDATLQTYLPEFADPKITLRDLLTHRSDIQDYIPRRDALPANELIAAYLELHAGENWRKQVRYTDTGFILLGLALEHVGGGELAELFNENVFKPLAAPMTYHPDPQQTVPTIPLYDNRGRLITNLCGIVHDPKARILGDHAGNAGIFATLAGIQKFTQMMLDFGQTAQGSFLKEKTIRDLYHDHSELGAMRSWGWRLAFDSRQQPVLFHTGYTGTLLMIDSFQKQALILLTNRVHPVDDRPDFNQKRDQLIACYLAEKQGGE